MRCYSNAPSADYFTRFQMTKTPTEVVGAVLFLSYRPRDSEITLARVKSMPGLAIERKPSLTNMRAL